MPRKKSLSFEESLAQLEAVVQKLESGDETLQDLMKDYSSGVELAQKCQSDLDRVEKAMDLLVKQDESGQVTEEELNIE